MNDALNAAIRASTLVWIHSKKIKNEKGKLVDVSATSPHFFMLDLYRDQSQEIATQKPSQIGVSTWAILSELHDARYWGINQIHTLPTGADVQKFVPSKVNEIIKQNPDIKAGLSSKEVDAVSQKQLGKAFLYFKGTHSEREALMLTSDRNTYDEIDKSDMTQIGNYESRLEGAGSLRQKRFISTPTMPGFGVNAVFEKSDQKYWRFTCPYCKKRQHMRWPENIDMKRELYVCSHCQEPLSEQTIRAGAWEAKYPKREISGYQLTQMIAPWIKPADMVKAYRDAEAGRNDMTLEYFYNHKLGLPYMDSTSQIPAALINQNLSNAEHTEENSVMGVDVQLHELYAILGNRRGVYGILRLPDSPEYLETDGKKGKSKWDRLGEIMDAYDVRYCVIDGGYTPNEVLAFAERYLGRVWVNWYKEDPAKKQIIRWADESFTAKHATFAEEVTVLTDRNRAIDQMLSQLRNGYIKFFYRPNDRAVRMLCDHVQTTYSRIVTDRVGLDKREWVSSGKDDLMHGLVYYTVALDRQRRTEDSN